MNIAVVVRGFHYLERDKFGYKLNSLDFADNFQEYILNPLRLKGKVTVFGLTNESPVKEEFKEKYSIDYLFSIGTSQKQTMLNGLGCLRDQFYDKIVILRPDMVWLTPINKWDIWEDKFYFIWKEFEVLWAKERRTGDMLHVLSSTYLEPFVQAILHDPIKIDFHTIYDYVATFIEERNIGFILEGFYDSGTCWDIPESVNPLYWTGNRPRGTLPCTHRWASSQK